MDKPKIDKELNSDKIVKLFHNGVSLTKIAKIEGTTFYRISKHLQFIGLRCKLNISFL